MFYIYKLVLVYLIICGQNYVYLNINKLLIYIIQPLKASLYI